MEQFGLYTLEGAPPSGKNHSGEDGVLGGHVREYVDVSIDFTEAKAVMPDTFRLRVARHARGGQSFSARATCAPPSNRRTAMVPARSDRPAAFTKPAPIWTWDLDSGMIVSLEWASREDLHIAPASFVSARAIGGYDLGLECIPCHG